MNIKDLKDRVENRIPPTGFAKFFKEWKAEQARMGFNWSPKSEELFRETMLTGMVFLDSLDSKTNEAPQKEVKKKEVTEKRTRTRNSVENTGTIETSNRTRTRTRTPN